MIQSRKTAYLTDHPHKLYHYYYMPCEKPHNKAVFEVLLCGFCYCKYAF